MAFFPSIPRMPFYRPYYKPPLIAQNYNARNQSIPPQKDIPQKEDKDRALPLKVYKNNRKGN